MKIAFRADASRESGSGHIMRLLPLIDEFSLQGYSCVLVGEINDLGWLTDLVEDRDLMWRRVSDFCATENPDEYLLVIDSYNLSSEDHFLGITWKYKVVIVDEATPKIKADLYVHPGYSEKLKNDYGPNLLWGPEFLLIRKTPETRALNQPPTQSSDVFGILCGGGSDPTGFVNEFLALYNGLGIELTLHVFTDSDNHLNLKEFIHFHSIGKDLDRYIDSASFAVVPASTLAFEFLARNIPIAIVKAVSNQKDNYSILSQKNLGLGVGYFDPVSGWQFDANLAKDFFSDFTNNVKRLSPRNNPIDLNGALRVCNQILYRAGLIENTYDS